MPKPNACEPRGPSTEEGRAPRGRWWKEAADSSVRCELCPHRCLIRPDAAGLCRVRLNRGGALSLPWYGACSGLAVDPIEKKPLYRFRPGSRIFSVGFVGCNLRCPFCQNWELSQGVQAKVERLSPEALVSLASASGTGAIAFTYSEPLVHAEYLVDAMGAARAAGLASVLVSNGCALPPASTEVLRLCDAANIDLKAWNPDFYRRELGGERNAVLRFIEEAVALGVHLEVTTLVIPGANDGEHEIEAIAGFLSALSPRPPLHLSAYRPMYRYGKPATEACDLERLATVARRHLDSVYVGNIAGEGNDDYCPACGALLVRRRGYAVDTRGLEAAESGGARCASCAAALAYRF